MPHVERKVFGVPVILYMALSMEIDITAPAEISAIYAKIFAHDGGIFDRFTTAVEDGYEATAHKVSYVKEAFYNILRSTAFCMFENGEDCLTKEDYLKTIEAEEKADLKASSVWFEFPIDNLYETGNRIEFVHKSLYEYFMADWRECLIDKINRKYPTEENLMENAYEYAAEQLAIAFKKGRLTEEICGYLKTAVKQKHYNRKNCLRFYLNTFTYMLDRGMTCRLDRKYIEKLFQTEIQIFSNMLTFLHVWIEDETIPFSDASKSQIAFYLRMMKERIDLNNDRLGRRIIHYAIYLSPLFLSRYRINLSYFDLAGIDLKACYLMNADLSYCNLSSADLREAILIRANLTGAKLFAADVRKAIMRDVLWCRMSSKIDPLFYLLLTHLSDCYINC